MGKLLRAAFSKNILNTSLKISLIVGTILNLINQGENLVHGENISWFHLSLNYLVPYLVASYSAAKNAVTPNKQ